MSDYQELTPTQRALIVKELELKSVRDDMRLNSAVINAIYNSNRSKNKPFRELWKKRKQNIDTTELKIGYAAVLDLEATDPSRAWVEKIYAANGKKVPTQTRR